MLEITILGLVFVSVAAVPIYGMPFLLEKLHKLQDKKVDETEKQLDKMFIEVKKEKLFLLYTAPPLILGLLFFLVLQSPLLSLIGIALGLFLPKLVVNVLRAQRRLLFQTQLVDGLMILSSSFKGGLTLLQAIEVLVEEMPAPLSQEFGLILRENKMGVTLEESLKHLNERLDLEEVKLFINSILVSRETGGDLTKVLSRLSTTIRDNRKLKDAIRTLTLQGRLQGIIMSILPFFFIFGVLTFNRNHFDIMLQTELGRFLLLLAAILQVCGIILMHKFSRIKL